MSEYNTWLTVIIITLIVCKFSLALDTTANLTLPLIPQRPDPYEIAYVRGDRSEVLKLIIFDLIGRGYLQIDGNLLKREPAIELSNLSSLEQKC